MNEERLRQLVRKRRDVPDQSWAYLLDKGFVGEALDKSFEAEMVEYALKSFDDLAAAAPVRAAGGRTQAVDRDGNHNDVATADLLQGLEAERQAALSEYVARLASWDPDVRRFRAEALGGFLLQADRAYAFLDSPEARAQRPGIKTGTVALPFPAKGGGEERIDVPAASVLGSLCELGDWLSGTYRWRVRWAVWFVLTGTIPPFPALTMGSTFRVPPYYDITINIEASPWVSASTVYKAYRRAQKRVLRRARGGRPTGKKNIALFRFVNQRVEPFALYRPGYDIPNSGWMAELAAEQDLPVGRDLMREWDARCSDGTFSREWRYGNNGGTRRFWRDYHRAREAIVWVEGGPATKARPDTFLLTSGTV